MIIDRACWEMLNNDVCNFVKAYNSWDEGRRIKLLDEIQYSEYRVLMTAIYVLGWRFNEESNKYEREENNS